MSERSSLLAIIRCWIYEGGSKTIRYDIQKPRQIENAATDI